MMKKQLFCVLSLLIVCSVCPADLVLKVTADDTVLAVGGETWMHVWGWVDDSVPASTNGLGSWQTDVVPGSPNGGSVFVTTGFEVAGVEDIKLLGPDPIETASGVPSWTSLNSPNGDIANLNALLDFTETTSTAGIGTGDGDIDNAVNYTLLASFHVEALSQGTVVYALDNIVGDLANLDPINGFIFYAGGSDVLSIVPEPATLLMLGLGSLVVCRRKK